MITFRLSWGGMGYSCHIWHGPQGPVHLTYQFRAPTAYNVGALNTEGSGVWPHQIAAPGTVYLEHEAYKGLPPAAAVEELWQEMVSSYLQDLETRNRMGLPAEPVPVKPRPVMYSMDRHMFVDERGEPAHATQPEEF